jgi:hypothetical protein
MHPCMAYQRLHCPATAQKRVPSMCHLWRRLGAAGVSLGEGTSSQVIVAPWGQPRGRTTQAARLCRSIVGRWPSILSIGSSP